MNREQEIYQWKNKVARHFKGGQVIILDIAMHTETKEEMVVYRTLNKECKLFTRPLKMFAEECTQEQFEQYGQKYRLELI